MTNNRKNELLIQTFYDAFKSGDYITMNNSYHRDAQFEDPAFGQLNTKEVQTMWKMLIERSKGALDISYSDLKADETTGSCLWESIRGGAKKQWPP